MIKCWLSYNRLLNMAQHQKVWTHQVIWTSTTEDKYPWTIRLNCPTTSRCRLNSKWWTMLILDKTRTKSSWMAKIIKVRSITITINTNIKTILYSYGLISWLKNALRRKTSEAINFKFWIGARLKNLNINASSPKSEHQWVLAKWWLRLKSIK